MEQKKKLFIIIGSIVAIILIGLSIWLGIKKQNEGTLSLTIVPNDSTVLIDNKDTGTFSPLQSREFGLTDGIHRLKVKRNDFTTSTQDIMIKKGEIKTLQILLEPANDKGREWLKNHPDQSVLYEAQASKESEEVANTLVSNYPFISLLPYTNSAYSINYGKSLKFPNDPLKITVYIDYMTDNDLFSAKNWLLSQGAQLDQLEIVTDTLHGGD